MEGKRPSHSHTHSHTHTVLYTWKTIERESAMLRSAVRNHQNSPKLATAPFGVTGTVLFFLILMGFYGTLLVIRNGRIHQLRPFIITSLLLLLSLHLSPIGFPSSFFCFFERLLLFFLLLLVGLLGERERERTI